MSASTAAEAGAGMARYAATLAGAAWLDLDAPPLQAWRDLTGEGRCRIGLDAADGGLGGGYRAIAAAAQALARGSASLGLALSWLGQVNACRFVLARLGSPEQKQRWLAPALAGQCTLAIAISEPGAGAHPKLLRGTALREGPGWRLDAEKAWTTNGPLADLFIVLAATDNVAGRKRYSLFLVPRQTPGLSLVATPPLGYLTPSPHCGLRLQQVRVAADALLGPLGQGYEALALPLRDQEDALLIATLAGGLLAQQDRLAELLPEAEDVAMALLGQHAAVAAAVAVLAGRLACMLDEEGTDGQALAPLSDAARLLAAQAQDPLRRFIAARGIACTVLDRLTRDIGKSRDIAASARDAKRARLGRRLVAARGRPA